MENNDFVLYSIGDIGELSSNTTNLLSLINKDEKNTKNKESIMAIMGDNVYPYGINTKDDITMKYMDDILRKVNLNKYIILGNHDWSGNAQAQIDYKSDQWNIENYYYKRSFVIDNTTIDIFFIDTQLICQGKDKTNKWEYFVDKIKKIFNKDPNLVRDEQLEWLENNLKMSTAKWKIVIGHYHIISSGLYDFNNELYNNLFHLFEKYNVDLYMCGHEHDLQHYILKGKKSDYQLNHFVSGSGSTTRHFRQRMKQPFAISDIGFLKCVINKNIARISFINSKNKELYNYTIHKKT